MRKQTFRAGFKANIVIELLKGEKELNVFASKNDIAPNQLRNWKNKFLDNAANAFDNKKDENSRKFLNPAKLRRMSYIKGWQFPTQVDWLKKI